MNIIQEGYTLKQNIDRMTARLREINKEIENMAEYKPGSKTGYLMEGNIKVKVSTRENVKWDQDRLSVMASHFGHFYDAFKPEFKPVSAKALEIAMVNDDFAQAVEWARTVTPGAPQVTYEVINDETEAAA